MQIQKILVSNFYSFRELELNFLDKSGIVQIIGINKDSEGSNGSGKSTIIEAISWGIYGKTIRKSTEEALVNTQAGEGCSVEVFLYKEGLGDVSIKRSKRPTSLTFSINGSISNKETAIETQKFIDKVLETDYKSFVAATVFGQHSEISFLDSSSEEKRNIIRNCFNLEDIFAKRESVKELKSSFGGELKTIDRMLESAEQERERTARRIPDTKYKFVELPPLEEILKAEATINSLKASVSKIQQDITKEKKNLKKIQDAIGKGEFEEKSECPICKSEYNVTQTSYDILDLKVKESVSETSLETMSKSVDESLLSIEKNKPHYSSIEWSKYNDKNKLINEAQVHIDNFNELESKIKKFAEEKKILTLDLEVMKFWEKAFSEQGMIRYVIRSILDYFNLKSNEYLSILTNNQFSILFSDDLSEEISNNGRPVKYISLSGGEKRKLNLSIMLALQELQNKISRTNINLVFFDEVCDNIDDLGIEAIHTLLNTLKDQYPDKVLFLITHNNYLKELFAESHKIVIEKRKGISKLINGN